MVLDNLSIKVNNGRCSFIMIFIIGAIATYFINRKKTNKLIFKILSGVLLLCGGYLTIKELDENFKPIDNAIESEVNKL